MEKKIINFALEFEKKGAILYLEFAFKVNNPLSKALFYTLAKQEIEHAERIEKFYAGLPVEVSDDILKVDSVEEDVKSFFEKIEKTTTSKESNIDVYETAIELEKKGYESYKKFLAESKNESEKELLQFLLNEEKKHLDSIVNVYSYLTGTSDWLEREESRVWNWMNL
jgi:rubrerythrin